MRAEAGLKRRPDPPMVDAMADCSSVSGASDAQQAQLMAVYQTAIARRAQDNARTQGAQAVQLVDQAAAPPPPPLPPDATISVRA